MYSTRAQTNSNYSQADISTGDNLYTKTPTTSIYKEKMAEDCAGRTISEKATICGAEAYGYDGFSLRKFTSTDDPLLIDLYNNDHTSIKSELDKVINTFGRRGTFIV